MRHLVVLALAATACGKSPPSQVTKVDNGMRLTFSSASGNIDAIAAVVRHRLELANTPAVVTTKGGLMVVDLPMPRDNDAFLHAVDLIAITARLDIRPLDEKSQWLDSLVAGVPPTGAVSSEVDQWMDTVSQQHSARFLFAKDHNEDITLERAKKLHCRRNADDVHDNHVSCVITGRQAIEDYLASAAAASPAYKVPDDREMVFERLDETTWRSYTALRQSPVPLDQVSAEAAGTDEVVITLPPAGKEALAKLTAESAGHKVAFIVDGRVVAAPIIAGSVTAGKFTLVHIKEPALLASALRGGSLPAPIVEETASEIKNGNVVPPPSM